MGKISRVFYAEVPREVCSVEEAGEYFYHLNLLHTHERFMKSYEEYEQKQVQLRNEVISQAIKNGELPDHPVMNSTIFGVSTMKQKPIIVIEC